LARTTKDIIAEARSLLDEINEANLDDSGDLLPSINRGYDYALSLLSRHYVAPLLANESVTLTSGTQDYDIPDAALEGKILKIEVYNNFSYNEIQRLDYSQITPFETSSRVSFPYYYTIVGNKYRLVPSPTATYPLRLWYAKHPGPLVEEQGAISIIQNQYVILDEAGASLSTSGNNAYVNIIDGETGEEKCTLQIQAISGNKVTFKSSPDRSSIYGRTVSNSVPSSVEKDDLICSAEGRAIPVLRASLTNFLVQFCVAEMTRKLGGEPTIEEKVKAEFEDALKKTYFGREKYSRIKKRSREWGTVGRRFWPSN
jgi:hypothetical protein